MIANPNNFITKPLQLLRAAAPKRHPGYMEECLRRSTLDATGLHVTFTKADFLEIRRLYNPKTSLPPILKGCC